MPIELCARRTEQLVMLGIGLVVVLGLAREAYVLAFGLETALRDLRQISLNAEQNLASWYTALLMSAGALLAWLAARRETGTAASASRFWRLACVLLLLAAADETVSFHEVLTLFLPDVAALNPLFHFAWVVVALPLLLALGLWCLWLMRPLPRATRTGLLASAIVFLAGALGLEMIDGAILVTWGEDSLAYRIGYILEDTLEMAGAAIFIVVLLRHLRMQGSRIELHLAAG